MKYNGLKLTPNIFADILILLFDGKQFSRQDAIIQVTQYFIDNGGIDEQKDYTGTFKAATRNLRNQGISNKGYGIWALTYKKKDVEIIEFKEEKITYNVDKELGEGENAVYVYYYDVYKKLAFSNSQNYWECKIGRTDRDPIQRIFNQAGTCYPEKPHLALIIYCDDSQKLEQAIHSILKYKKRWLNEAPGTEWFLTSPEEVEEIYMNLL